MQCIACGSNNLIDGTINWTGTDRVKFQPKGRRLLQQVFSIGTRDINSHACIHCGHLHLMVEFTQEDKDKYLRFEGPQLSAVEGED
jgi:predicted nucleic-acid-binding Zn-ribbon protein